MEDFPICHTKHKKHVVQKLTFSYPISIPPPSFSASPFITKEVGVKGYSSFFSKTHLSRPSFSTPEFTHLPHHDNYLHGNHS